MAPHKQVLLLSFGPILLVHQRQSSFAALMERWRWQILYITRMSARRSLKWPARVFVGLKTEPSSAGLLPENGITKYALWGVEDDRLYTKWWRCLLLELSLHTLAAGMTGTQDMSSVLFCLMPTALCNAFYLLHCILSLFIMHLENEY